MSSITVCIMVKNEEDILEDCIKSVYGNVEEILVIDNGSSDNSVSIAQKYKCKVIHAPDATEAEGRNLFFKYATSSWLLVLDADERIEVDSIMRIRSVINKTDNSTFGYRLPEYQYIGNGKWAAIDIFRLIKNDKRIKYAERKLHTSPTDSIHDFKGNMGKLTDTPIHHFDILFKLRTPAKREKYLKKLIEEVDKSKDPHMMSYLGIEYMAINELNKAENLFKKSLDLDYEQLTKSRLYLAILYVKLGMLKEAERETKELINLGRPSLEDRAFSLLADIAFRNGDYNNAEYYCRKALNYDPFGAHNYLNLAFILSDKNPSEAINLLYEAVRKNPYLNNKEIYKQGQLPNIYSFQSSFLSSFPNAIELHLNLCKKLSICEDFYTLRECH